MTTALQLGRKVVTERDDGTITTATFYNDRVASGAIAAIELHNRDEGPVTFRDFCDRYYRYHAKIRMLPRTLVVYERQITPLLPEFADVATDAVADHVAEYFHRRVQAGEVEGLIPAMRTLSAVMGVAFKWGYIDQKPMSVGKLITTALLGDNVKKSK